MYKKCLRSGNLRKKCLWENTTAIIAIRNSRILQRLGGDICKVFSIREPKLFGTTPYAILSYLTTRNRLEKESAITLFERGIASMGTPANIIIPSKTLKL